MRWIKFCGKRVDNGEWVYGDLARDTYDKNDYETGETYYVDGHEVDPDSIGQFTELYDKEEIPIYENDILAKPAGWRNGVKQTDYTLVVWHQGGFYLKEQNGCVYPIGEYYLGRMTVVGRVFDRPSIAKLFT